jgi:uncharacterized protein
MASSDPSTWKLPRLRIDRDGEWFHEGEEVSHEGILSSLRQGLQVDPAGHFLQIGLVRVPVEVEDAPFVIVRFEADGEGWALWLSDGTREALDPTSLLLREGDVPYCRVKGARFEARFSRAAAWQLLQRVATEPGGGPPTLVADRRRYPLGA